MIQIAPSILSADFTKLGREIELVDKAGANAIHVDVMDGHFVPNITIGPPVIKSIKNITRLPLDVHLMIEEPDRFIPSFVKAGADRLSIHVEACVHLHRSIQIIRSSGVKAGVALNPGTPLGHISEILHMLDFVLIMSVNPGFGGQEFIASSLDKINRLFNVLKTRGLKAVIAVDGGVNCETAPDLVKAGARILIAGNAIFNTQNPAKAVQDLIAAAKITKPINKKDTV
ncbi:ribulose-phosphate 3-epimerase [bacterium]|nr:ribulose-phosphate 3-epimerase [candidate division CSSED10-310 bacterium]